MPFKVSYRYQLSLVAESGGYSLLWCAGFALRWLLSLRSMGSRRVGFISCSTRAQQLWCTGLVAPRHVGSSRTRARNCIGRRILFFFLIYLFVCLFVYLWPRWVFVAAHRLSLVAASGGYSLLRCAGFSLWWLLLLRSTGSRRVGFSSCGTWARGSSGSRVQPQ